MYVNVLDYAGVYYANYYLTITPGNKINTIYSILITQIYECIL